MNLQTLKSYRIIHFVYLSLGIWLPHRIRNRIVLILIRLCSNPIIFNIVLRYITKYHLRFLKVKLEQDARYYLLWIEKVILTFFLHTHVDYVHFILCYGKSVLLIWQGYIEFRIKQTNIRLTCNINFKVQNRSSVNY